MSLMSICVDGVIGGVASVMVGGARDEVSGTRDSEVVLVNDAVSRSTVHGLGVEQVVDVGLDGVQGLVSPSRSGLVSG